MQVCDIPIQSDRRESTLHGEAAFPLALYHSLLSKNVLGYTDWHWHNELQFCLVTSGSVLFRVNETQHLLEKGDGIFIGSGCLHMALPQGGCQSAYLCLDAGQAFLSSFPGSVFELQYVIPYWKSSAVSCQVLLREIPWQNTVLEDLQAIYQLWETRPFGYEFDVFHRLGRMWCAIIQHAPSKEHSRPYAHSNSIVQGILAYLYKEYAKQIRIDDIAKAVGFSGSECCRLFKQVTGSTIFSYLQSYRLAQATRLLEESRLSISEISYETGFCSASYFSECFKAKTGLTPRQYRQRL